MLLLLAVLVLSPMAWAQSTADGAIGGIVVDPSGAVMQSAAVSARNVATDAVTKGQTDVDGRFLLIHLQPGAYEVEIEAQGMATVKRRALVEVGRVTTLDTAMAVAGTAESVTVTDQAPVVNTVQQDFATNLNQTAINNLPINGRRWFNFALTTPGAVTDGGFGDISFRGLSGLMNNNTVDGGDNNQAFFSEEKGRTRIAYSTSQESIREFQVNTSAYSAEYGRAAGGVINAVTKSGTNELHGDLFYLNRNSSWGAFIPYPFAVAPLLVNGSYVSTPIKPVDIRQQFGGDVGGWIIKSKLFYYFNYDEQLRSFPAVATPSNPAGSFGALSSSELTTLTNRLGPGTAANLSTAQIQQYVNNAIGLFAGLSGTAARKGNQELWFPKIDYKPTDNNTVTLSYNRLRWRSPYGVQTNLVVNRGLDSFGDDFVKDDTGAARWVSVIGPTMTNELRFQYSRDFEYEYANPELAGVPTDATGYSPQVIVNPSPGFTFGKPYYTQRYAYPTEKRTQVADTASWAHGEHFLKFGVDYNHVNDTIQHLAYNGGDFEYNSRADFFSDYIASQVPSVLAATKGMVCGTAAAPLQCYNLFQQAFGPLGFTFNTNEIAVFAQDQWRLSPRITLNLGLRYEFQTMPPAQIANPAFAATGVLNSDKRDFGPRIGFAWDVNGDGKTAVRAGYGIYYGRIINATIFEAIANTGVSNAQITATITPSTAGNVGPVYPNIVTTLTGTVAKPSILYFPGDLRNPMIHEWDAIVERQIAPNTIVSLSWIGSLGHFLPEPLDTNLPPPSTVTYTVSGGPLNGDAVTVPFFKGARPNTAFNQITMISTSAHSIYNAGVFQFSRRMSQGIQVQASYTLSETKDDNLFGTGSTTTPTNGAIDAYDMGYDQGFSSFDIRHKVVGSVVWQPTYFDKSHGALHWLLSGWTVAPVFFAGSGLPFTPTVSGNPPSGSGNTASGVTGSQASTSRVPFLERGSYRYPGQQNVDLRIAKAFLIHEKIKLELSGEAFNLFNHLNFTSVTTQMFTLGGTAAAPTLTYFQTSTSGFGLLTNGNNNNVVGPRNIQIGARISF
ncbi:MAG TPA: TonB-dependent receptor [Bryobacteraceae bacterium]|nr:TonB-dependent receptor [Bryobacteraceae bacterium]